MFDTDADSVGVDGTDTFSVFFLKRTIKHSQDFLGCSDCPAASSHFALQILLLFKSA